MKWQWNETFRNLNTGLHLNSGVSAISVAPEDKCLLVSVLNASYVLILIWNTDFGSREKPILVSLGSHSNISFIFVSLFWCLQMLMILFVWMFVCPPPPPPLPSFSYCWPLAQMKLPHLALMSAVTDSLCTGHWLGNVACQDLLA